MFNDVKVGLTTVFVPERKGDRSSVDVVYLISPTVSTDADCFDFLGFFFRGFDPPESSEESDELDGDTDTNPDLLESDSLEPFFSMNSLLHLFESCISPPSTSSVSDLRSVGLGNKCSTLTPMDVEDTLSPAS